MKLIKTASGKKKIKISKKDWASIGKKAGWFEGEQSEDATGYDAVNDIMDKAINNSSMFREMLKDNPELCDSLSTALEYQQSGYQGESTMNEEMEEILSTPLL